jgi:hypothetical protein
MSSRLDGARLYIIHKCTKKSLHITHININILNACVRVREGVIESESEGGRSESEREGGREERESHDIVMSAEEHICRYYIE